MLLYLITLLHGFNALHMSMNKLLDVNVMLNTTNLDTDEEFLHLMNLWAGAMIEGDYTTAASVYTDDGDLTVSGTSYDGLEKIGGFFAYLGPSATKLEYNYLRCSSDDCTFKGKYNFGQPLGIFSYEITLADGKIQKEVVEPDVEDNAFLELMSSWVDAMMAGDYTAAATVYTADGSLTVNGNSYVGLEDIEGFFATLGPSATKCEYNSHRVLQLPTYDLAAHYTGTYDFGQPLGTYTFDITFADGKILKEVVVPENSR